jgi:hypothetical protein
VNSARNRDVTPPTIRHVDLRGHHRTSSIAPAESPVRYARHRLPNGMMLESVVAMSTGGLTLLRKSGDTFHCHPSSVMIVTVFLLYRVSIPSTQPRPDG